MQTVYTLPVKVRTEVVAPLNKAAYTVVEVPSSSGNKMYRVDLTNRRCSCPGWIFSKERKMCKHLRAFGFTDLVARAKEPEVVNGMVAL